MNKYYEDEDSNLDKMLLIARRVFLVLFVWIIIWILLFRVIWVWKNKINIDQDNIINKNIDKTDTNNTQNENKNEEKNINTYIEAIDLGKNYTKTNEHIYYRWKIVESVNVQEFNVITEKWRYNATWNIINSNNLLKIFSSWKTRVLLMKYIDDIIKNETNVTSELKWASENWMYKMEFEYDVLSKFDRNDRYDMTDQQRAKFAIMFLYIKIAKAMNNNEISMEVALVQLKEFLENFDKNDLSKEKSEENLKKIKWDIGLDNYCIYVNGKLYSCFLDKIFVK